MEGKDHRLAGGDSGFKGPIVYEGFRNLGNTCYMGALLTALAAIPDFVTNVNNLRTLADNAFANIGCSEMTQFRQKAILEELCEALNGVKEGDPPSLETFKQAIGVLHPRFSGNAQEDTHELYMSIMDSLEGVCRFCDAYHKKVDEMTANDGARVVEYEKLGLPFHTVTETECMECKAVTRCKEQALTLNVDIPKAFEPKDFDAWKLWSADSDLGGQNSFECSNCEHKTAATRHSRMFSYPKVLAVHYKLFKSSIQLSGYVLVSKTVPSPHPPMFIKCDELAGIDQKQTRAYILHSMVIHVGPSHEQGHYVCARRTGDNSVWLLFNDHTVRPRFWQDLFTDDKSTPYLMFYTAV